MLREQLPTHESLDTQMQYQTGLQRRARILVADDDEVFRECAVAHLAVHLGHIDVAPDGRQAWDMLNARPYDMVLVGLDIPNVGALELVMRMRAAPALKFVPVVVITGRDDLFSVDRAYEVGVTSFAARPISWSLLTYQLRCALRASRAEAETRRSRDRAESAAAIRDNMFRLMRHETRTPLNSIMGFAELIEKEVHGPLGNDAYNGYASYIREAGERLLGSLSEMLLFAQLVAGEAELAVDEYRLGPIVIDAIARVEPKARQNQVDIHAETADGMDTRITCDRQLLLCAVRNLVDNAVTHGKRGGAVTVSASVTPDGDVIIVVRDQGPGLSPDELARCAEPFYQADMSLSRSKGGLGIGLPVAKRIVTLHCGELTLVSTQGEGTTARIVLAKRGVDRIGDASPTIAAA